jgi:hypothetical protein
MRNIPKLRVPHCTENYKTNIPRNETARARSQFLQSCICEQFILYSNDRSAFFSVLLLRTDRSQIQEFRNWEGRAVSFMEIFVSNFRYTAFAVQAQKVHE